jgi:hypothetical protein
MKCCNVQTVRKILVQWKPLITALVLRHLYSVRCSVVPINSPLLNITLYYFYCCTVHFDDSIIFIHQLMHYIYIYIINN